MFWMLLRSVQGRWELCRASGSSAVQWLSPWALHRAEFKCRHSPCVIMGKSLDHSEPKVLQTAAWRVPHRAWNIRWALWVHSESDWRRAPFCPAKCNLTQSYTYLHSFSLSNSLWSIPLPLLPCSCSTRSLLLPEFEGSGVLRETEGPSFSPTQPSVSGMTHQDPQSSHKKIKRPKLWVLPFSFLFRPWVSSVNICSPMGPPSVQSWTDLDTFKPLHRLPVLDGGLGTCMSLLPLAPQMPPKAQNGKGKRKKAHRLRAGWLEVGDINCPGILIACWKTEKGLIAMRDKRGQRKPWLKHAWEIADPEAGAGMERWSGFSKGDNTPWRDGSSHMNLSASHYQQSRAQEVLYIDAHSNSLAPHS